jgi:Zn-dependent M16 (insulinase) family peptidase
MTAGEEAHGFRIDGVMPIREIHATAYRATHLATGADVLHLHCHDRENLFAISFRTPPPDSTGVAHILEHCVLAGSERYPVKDAFNELQKGSLNTFTNAFTGADFTSYPAASQVRVDFYNVAGVYADLVFRPLLSRHTFMQEGHHLEVRNGGLGISGVVYNEMKGAFSTPESVAHARTLRSLFPSNAYGVESGGDPEHIPDLTYEAFRDFHRRFYSPTNARIFFYGDIETRSHLEFLEKELSRLSRVEVDSEVAVEPRWTDPRTVIDRFPIGPDDPEQDRAIVNVAWLTSEIMDLEERLILEVLEEALVGNAAAPLRKALIDSGLGEDLSPDSGFHSWYRQMPFVAGLRGTEAARAEQIETLTLEALRKIASEGIEREQLEAAFHQVEFHGLEISRRRYPFGVSLLLRAMGSWFHANDPLSPLTFPTLVTNLRKRWRREPDLFEGAVRRWLVDNPHRLRAVIVPDRHLDAEREEKVRRRLDTLRNSMSRKEIESVRKAAEELREAQRGEESPEALATLPRLQLSDIPSDVETIPTDRRTESGVAALEHELFSNGIAYLDVAFDVSDIPDDLQVYLPLLGEAITGMGAAGLDYVAMEKRRALRTGALSAALEAWESIAEGPPAQLFVLRASALARNIEDMVSIVRDALMSPDLTDRGRLRDIVSETRNDMRASVAPEGHLFVERSAAAGLSLAARRREQWHGATQIRFLSHLSRRFETHADEAPGNLERLRGTVFRRGRMVLNLTGDAACLPALRRAVGGLIRSLPDGGPGVPTDRPRGDRQPIGVALPGEVGYVGRVVPAPKHREPVAPHLAVLARYLSDSALYKRIRVEGGAYGAFGLYDGMRGQFSMLSYRDPNLEKTIEVYDRVLDLFGAEDLDADKVRQRIVAVVAKLDPPMDPAVKGYTALRRELTGMTDEDRRRFRAGVLATDERALRCAAEEVLRPAMSRACQSVYAPRDWIERANRTMSPPFEIVGLE